jgi:hypothetical protein
MLKMPYILKKPYGGTPEPQTTHDALWLHGPSLEDKNKKTLSDDRTDRA